MKLILLATLALVTYGSKKDEYIIDMEALVKNDMDHIELTEIKDDEKIWEEQEKIEFWDEESNVDPFYEEMYVDDKIKVNEMDNYETTTADEWANNNYFKFIGKPKDLWTEEDNMKFIEYMNWKIKKNESDVEWTVLDFFEDMLGKMDDVIKEEKIGDTSNVIQKEKTKIEEIDLAEIEVIWFASFEEYKFWEYLQWQRQNYADWHKEFERRRELPVYATYKCQELNRYETIISLGEMDAIYFFMFSQTLADYEIEKKIAEETYVSQATGKILTRNEAQMEREQRRIDREYARSELEWKKQSIEYPDSFLLHLLEEKTIDVNAVEYDCRKRLFEVHFGNIDDELLEYRFVHACKTVKTTPYLLFDHVDAHTFHLLVEYVRQYRGMSPKIGDNKYMRLENNALVGGTNWDKWYINRIWDETSPEKPGKNVGRLIAGANFFNMLVISEIAGARIAQGIQDAIAKKEFEKMLTIALYYEDPYNTN